MFLSPSRYRHPEFLVGVREMAGAVPGIATWGLMTGVAMVDSGLSQVEAVAMALMVFAGSSQLAAMPLIVAGAPMWVILATGFCVNLRFVVFSAHLRAYMMHLPLLQRMLSGYLAADVSYVLFTRRFPKPGETVDERAARDAYLAGNCAVNWGGWVSCNLIGIFLARGIPTSWGLGFAGILALVGILCSLAVNTQRIVSASVAALAAVAAFALPLHLNIVVAIAAAVSFCLITERHLWPTPPEEQPRG